MFLAKRDPFFTDIDRIFNDSWHSIPLSLPKEPRFENKAAYPVRSAKDAEGNLSVEFDVPGFDKKDLEVQYSIDTLSVRSLISKEGEGTKNRRVVSYRVYAPDLDPNSIEAICEKGVLSITGKPQSPEQVIIKIK